MTAGPSNFSFQGILKITRFPNLLIIALSQYLVAIFLVFPEPRIPLAQDLKLHLLVLSTMLIAAAGYIINDYYDVKIDLINKPERVVVGKVIKRRVIMLLHSSFNMMAILIGIYVGPWVAAIHVLSSFILWLYSNQLKRLPFIGNFSVSLMTGLSILIISVYYQSFEPLVFVYAFFAR
jgi:4-hydroxybenzoate polyprenyltransferase